MIHANIRESTKNLIFRKALTESSSPLTGNTAMLLSIDGRVHIRDIEVETKNWMKKLILVIVVRLGAAELNPVCWKSTISFIGKFCFRSMFRT